MKIVISALHFAWQEMEQCLSRVSGEFGLDGVELSWHASFARPHCTREDLAVLARQRGRTGLVLDAHIWEDLARLGSGPAEQALLKWLECCRQTGVSGLVIHGGSRPDRREGVAVTRRILDGVLGQFERAGVALKLENHYAYEYRDCQELFSEPWEFLEVFALDSPALRFCFDTGHGHMTRNGEELLRQLAPWLTHVHLADNHGEHDDHCGFRQGTVPWDAYWLALREIRFDGTFCVEFPVRDDQAPFRRCTAELRARFASPPSTPAPDGPGGAPTP